MKPRRKLLTLNFVPKLRTLGLECASFVAIGRTRASLIQKNAPEG
jgi:hypothetical protein